MASTSGQVLDGIVGENEEVEGELVDVEALMIEGHDGILARDNRGTEGMGSGSGNGSGRGSEESQSRSETGESRETPANRDLTPESSAAQRFAGVPRSGLPRGARLPGPSAPAAGWAGPMHGPRWPLRNPNDGTRPPPSRWRKAARCAVAVGATRELPVRRRRFCADTGLRATTFASVASALRCVSDQLPDAQRARRLPPGRSLLSLPNRVGVRRRLPSALRQPSKPTALG